MTEEENPVEQVHEHLHHTAEHSGERWVMGVALTSAILAAVAAVASLFSGHSANHAMLAQIKASDEWAYYQAKGIKTTVLQSQAQLLSAMGKPVDAAVSAKIEENDKTKHDIELRAKSNEAESTAAFELHEIFSRAVTLFQVAIAISAISVLARRKRFWWVSIGFGCIGLYFFAKAMLVYSAEASASTPERGGATEAARSGSEH